MKNKKNKSQKSVIIKNWKKNADSRFLFFDYRFDREKSRIEVIDHCCQMMTRGVNDQRIFINYVPRLRVYAINVTTSRVTLQLMFHCPWCGYKLPKNLRKEYRYILEKEYNLDCFDEEQKKRIPEEFKSDEWWKKRGL